MPVSEALIFPGPMPQPLALVPHLHWSNRRVLISMPTILPGWVLWVWSAQAGHLTWHTGALGVDVLCCTQVSQANAPEYA